MGNESVLAEIRKLLGDQTAPGITWAELWEFYVPYLQTEVRSWKTQVGRAVHVLRILGTKPVLATTVRDLDAYRAQRRREPGRHAPQTSEATRNREIMLMRAMCSFGVERGHLPHYPPEMAKAPMETEDNVRELVFTPDQLRQMKRAIAKLPPPRNYYLRAMMQLLAVSGMRIGEARKLRLAEIDEKAHVAYVVKRGTKTRQARFVPVTDAVLDAIEAIGIWPGKTYVFEHKETGEPYGWSYFRKWFVRAIHPLGIRGPNGEVPTRHDLRRTFVTVLRKMGEAETTVMKITGHKDRRMFDRYNITDARDAMRAAHKFQKLFVDPQPKPDPVPLRYTLPLSRGRGRREKS